jgi:membrane associated rhomboid family serine protease
MERYPFLRFATAVLRILGWIILVIGVIGSIVFGIRTGPLTGVFYAVGGSIFSFLAWLFLLATRELLYLLIQVEENTRNTAERISITEESSQD